VLPPAGDGPFSTFCNSIIYSRRTKRTDKSVLVSWSVTPWPLFFKCCADQSTTNDGVRPSTTDYSREVVVEIYVGGRQLRMLVGDR
jgi:hypothetical protein